MIQEQAMFLLTSTFGSKTVLHLKNANLRMHEDIPGEPEKRSHF